MAYRNVQQLAYRSVPLVRRELDKQLTIMVLVQVFCDIVAITPLIIYTFWTLIIGTTDDLLRMSQVAFMRHTTSVLYNFHFVVSLNDIIKISISFIFLYISRSSFYIYICVSKRFRQQLIHVLSTNYLHCCFPRRIIMNQVEPQT